MKDMTNENQLPAITEETSKRITSLRFLLIVFVVFIHAKLTPDAAINYYHYDFVQPKWIEVFKNFVCIVLGGAAVPLFFFFSSYLQFSKTVKYSVLLGKRSKTLLLPYVCWTSITILLYFVAQSIPQAAPYFMNPIHYVRNWDSFAWVRAFTYHDLAEGLKNPLVFQFWFLRELMIYIILSPVLEFLCNKFPFPLFFAVAVASIKHIPLYFTVSSVSLFYYLLGCYVAQRKIDFFKLADKISYSQFVFLLFFSSVIQFRFDGTSDSGFFEIIVSCLFFLKVSSLLVKHERIYVILEQLSVYSFFLYAAHAPFIHAVVNKMTHRLISLHGILCLVQFLVAALVTMTIGVLIGVLLRKICPSAFRILNGGRK